MSDGRQQREQQRAKTAELAKHDMAELRDQLEARPVADDACPLCFGEGGAYGPCRECKR